MKVFAHFLGDDMSKDGFQYRWRTLLQFGNSWNVIGSVIMKNPGSAMPIEADVGEMDLANLSKFDSGNNNWRIFVADNTMRLIEKLFVARNGGSPLNGVVQIFNLFNIRNADLDNALANYDKAIENVFSTVDDDIEAMREFESPIYIGWGALGSDYRFKEQAEKLFNFVRYEMKQNYLFPDFYSNVFYHPQYLMGRGKNKPRSIEILKAFCLNSCYPETLK